MLGVIVAGSILPSLVLMLWMRSRDRHGIEPLGAVLKAFLFGGTLGALVALVLNTLFGVAAAQYTAAAGAVFLGTVVAAPFIEEAAKALGLGGTRRHVDEWEDGIVYGAAIGLGFAATENILYGLQAYFSDEPSLALGVVAMRAFSSTILHAVTTAFLGFGYGIIVLRGGVAMQLLPYYLMAVAIHAAYNFLVLWNSALGFGAALVMVWVIFASLSARVRQLDALPHTALRR